MKTHPNPYVRTRWGFTEWIVGPEPSQTKELLRLVWDVEGLDKLYYVLLEALDKGPAATGDELTQQYQEALRTLHEMSQPLATRSVMRTKGEKLLYQIQQMNELGSLRPESGR